MRSLIASCFLACSLHLGPADAARADVARALAQLTNANTAGDTSQATLHLRSLLAAKSADAPLIRGKCSETLMLAREPRVVRRMAFILAAEPNENAIRVLARRLSAEASVPMRSGLCGGMRGLLLSTPELQATTRQAVLRALEESLQDRMSPPELVEGALLAAAATGSPGFDLVVETYAKNRYPVVKDVFYSILAETRDNRAVGVLLEAVRNPGLRGGLRTQAIRALGVLASSSGGSGVCFTDSQMNASAQALIRVLEDQNDDQLFSTALVALGRIVDVNQRPQMLGILDSALSSEIACRRGAALAAIYAAQTPPDEATLALVRYLSEWDPEEDIRADAEAVLDKFMVESN